VTREPDELLVSEMADPYVGVGERGSAPPLVRASAVMNAVGASLGLSARPGDTLRAHGAEAWATRLALLVDLGGDARLEAAWNDLLEGTLAATRVDPEVKRALRDAQARVLDTRAGGGDAGLRRRRLLAELARALAELGD
jgi:hypothetical protein